MQCNGKTHAEVVARMWPACRVVDDIGEVWFVDGSCIEKIVGEASKWHTRTHSSSFSLRPASAKQ